MTHLDQGPFLACPFVPALSRGRTHGASMTVCVSDLPLALDLAALKHAGQSCVGVVHSSKILRHEHELLLWEVASFTLLLSAQV